MIEIIPNWHPLLVHFTIALWSVAVILFLIGRLFHGTGLGENSKLVACYNLWLGAAFSVLTALAGWDAYNTVAHDDLSHAAMTDHRNWALLTLVVFLALTAWTLFLPKVRQQPSGIFLGAGLLALVLLMTTGYKGAELVYRYGLGVMSLPTTEAHAHSHGAGSRDHVPGGDMATPDDMRMDRIGMDAHEDGDHHDHGHDDTHTH